MNSVIEAINHRRSTRCFEEKPVPKEVLNMIVEAGNQAPYTSMTRSQPWRFVVVQDQAFKQKLFQTTFPIWKQSIEGMKTISLELYEMAMSLYNAMEEPKDVVYYNAPAIVFVIGPADNAVSCALACENIMIAAESLGLGSCYVGFGAMVKGNTEVTQTLELKADEAIYGPILLGYPKVNPPTEVATALEKIGPNKKDAQIKWIYP
ncbi:MAG: nitroreductase family protein [Candidatus Bathyarchaeota archaeon]|nr:nitroreductase family protein [Candidatus Bathyarchaeota archaeon]